MLMTGIESGEFDENEYVNFHFYQNGVTHVVPHTNITLNLVQNGQVTDTWILLDNQSTIDVYHNKNL
jgi:hypothetical protein